jgi:hypothetical protein
VRSRQMALGAPATGDEWGFENGELRQVVSADGASVECLVFTDTCRGEQRSFLLKSFRKWASGAGWLGGAQ